MTSNMTTLDLEASDPKVRNYSVDGRTFKAKCSDPYGFWTITLPDGPVPKELAGQYTSFGDVERSIITYMNKLKMKQETLDGSTQESNGAGPTRA